MASVQATLRFMAADTSLLDTLARLNLKLCQELDAREFVAVILGRFDPESGRLELANCGLPDPYLLREGEPPRTLEVTGPRLPLGLRSHIDYQTLAVRLQAGDRLLVVTDGLPEAPTPGGEPLGYDALVGMMDHAPAGSPLHWLDRLLERVTAATEPADDLTALLLHFRPLRSDAERVSAEQSAAPGFRKLARDRRASGG
jgi:sigma-B regulation protein RsbU (phosphoserine phosphatase)